MFVKGFNNLTFFFFQIYKEHPLGSKDFYCNASKTDHYLPYNTTGLPDNYTTSTELVTSSLKNFTVMVPQGKSAGVYSAKVDNSYSESGAYSHGKGHYDKVMNEPNTALLSTILIFGTFLIAYFLRIFRNSKFLGRSVSVFSRSICTSFKLCILTLYQSFGKHCGKRRKCW